LLWGDIVSLTKSGVLDQGWVGCPMVSLPCYTLYLRWKVRKRVAVTDQGKVPLGAAARKNVVAQARSIAEGGN